VLMAELTAFGHGARWLTSGSAHERP
jgi:hypothetical protein